MTRGLCFVRGATKWYSRTRTVLSTTSTSSIATEKKKKKKWTRDAEKKGEKKHVAVVGGGMAGLGAAAGLVSADEGYQCTVFDAGFAPGGRSCSRPVKQGTQDVWFDHGCQFIRPKTVRFKEVVEEWTSRGWLVPWKDAVRVKIELDDGRGDEEERVLIPNTNVFTSIGGGGGSITAEATAAASTMLGKDCREEEEEVYYVGNPYMGNLALSLCGYLERGGREKDGDTTAAAADGTTSSSGMTLCRKTKVGAVSFDATKRMWDVYLDKEKKKHVGSFDALIAAEGGGILQHAAESLPGLMQAVRPAFSVAYTPVFSFLCITNAGVRDRLGFDVACIEESSSASGISGLQSFQFLCNATSKSARALAGEGQEAWVAITTREKAADILCRWPLQRNDGSLIPQDESYRKGVARELADDFSSAVDFIQRLDAAGASPPSPPLQHPAVGAVEYLYMDSQRWGRAFPENAIHGSCIFSPEYAVAVCGDCFTGDPEGILDPVVDPMEAAWLSGTAAAESFISSSSSS